MYKLLLSLAASLTRAACAVQPASHADLPSTVQSIAPSGWSVDAPQDSADSAAWWQQFGDPVLHELVTSVLNQNLDLQAALERVKQAQAVTTQRAHEPASRYANNPASVVTWLPRNFSFKRLSKLTRKSLFWQSPIGFPSQHGTNWQNTPVVQG